MTLAPARHFSGRGIWDRDSTLWGSWIISSNSLNVYFSGDGGYSDAFKTIGQNFGPFDFAFIDSGAYDADWSQIHLMPEETVQASIDLDAKVLIPIGWSKFDLALHPWDEPAIRLTKEAEKRANADTEHEWEFSEAQIKAAQKRELGQWMADVHKADATHESTDKEEAHHLFLRDADVHKKLTGEDWVAETDNWGHRADPGAYL